MDEQRVYPLTPFWKRRTAAFLAGLGLRMDDDLDFTVLLTQQDEIVATGSRKGNILKCIGVSDQWRGEGLSAAVVSDLVKDAVEHGYRHLFLYTRPCSRPLFGELGFYPVAHTRRVALMENERNGVANFVRSVRAPEAGGRIGCIVANCNPFTNGHLYLAEYAAAHCDFLYFFVLSEDRSFFSTGVRTSLAAQGLAHIPNIKVCNTGEYLISSATFPDYFIKDKADAANVHYDLDIAVFGQCFAGQLGITRRFVGTEPRDAVTRGYNLKMKESLHQYGVEFVEIERQCCAGGIISASTVRRLYQAGDMEGIRPFVPDVTYRYLEKTIGLE